MKLLVTGISQFNNKPLKVVFAINARNFWQAHDTSKRIIETHYRNFHEKTKGNYELRLEKV